MLKGLIAFFMITMLLLSGDAIAKRGQTVLILGPSGSDTIEANIANVIGDRFLVSHIEIWADQGAGAGQVKLVFHSSNTFTVLGRFEDSWGANAIQSKIWTTNSIFPADSSLHVKLSGASTDSLFAKIIYEVEKN